MALEFLEIDTTGDAVFVDHERQTLYCVIRPRSKYGVWDVSQMAGHTNAAGEFYSYFNDHGLPPEEAEETILMGRVLCMGNKPDWLVTD